MYNQSKTFILAKIGDFTMVKLKTIDEIEDKNEAVEIKDEPVIDENYDYFMSMVKWELVNIAEELGIEKIPNTKDKITKAIIEKKMEKENGPLCYWCGKSVKASAITNKYTNGVIRYVCECGHPVIFKPKEQ